MNSSPLRCVLALRALGARATPHPQIPRACLVRVPASTQRAYATPAPASRNPRNEEIRHRMVQLVDAETGKLLPLAPLRDILRTVDLAEHWVELVTETPAPVVKLVSKKEMYDRAKQLRLSAKTKGKAPETKELQMTWGVAPGDLGHKLKKARQEIEKGNRVDVAFAPKKGQTLPSPREMEAKVGEALAVLQDVGKEWKPRTVEKNMTIVYLQKHPNA